MDRIAIIALFSVASFLFPLAHGWGVDGHHTICKIAQSRLSKAAADAVEALLPEYANGDLASVCSWADRIRSHYNWSAALHFISIPDNLCTHSYTRDCKDAGGVKDRCISGAIQNYTSQLLDYGSSSSQSGYNLTEALMFLSHFVGDIHQPLHVGFTTDRGGNDIEVQWYTIKDNLHAVWDKAIIETAEKVYYNSDVKGLVDAIQENITREWADRIEGWESCSPSTETVCPDIYANESIGAACDSSYEGVSNGSILEDEYFHSRLPIVNLRLAKAGVRLAATLNRIFNRNSIRDEL